MCRLIEHYNWKDAIMGEVFNWLDSPASDLLWIVALVLSIFIAWFNDRIPKGTDQRRAP